MRLPKTVQICGKTYDVELRKNKYGGGRSTSNLKLFVGGASQKPERKFEIFVHEVMELAACERDFRYGTGGSTGSMFVMNHKEFDHFAADTAAALMPMLR